VLKAGGGLIEQLLAHGREVGWILEAVDAILIGEDPKELDASLGRN
jgi:hypothetical protein